MKTRLYQLIAVGALCLAALALAVSLWSSVRAQENGPEAAMSIPTTLNYQGFLREPDGSLTNGSFKITARIYNVATGGTALYSTTLNDVNVRDGLFNIVLGDNPALPGSLFANSPLYIGISLNDLSELIPRQRLHAVPWAFQASTLVNNATINGLTSNGNVTVNGDTTMNGSATISGNTTMSSNATISGDTSIKGNLFVAITPVPGTGNLTMSGDAKIYGNVIAGSSTDSQVILPGDGYWGTWWGWTDCPQYTYVCGARVRIEGDQGGGDDTAMNGIQLKCCSLGFNPASLP